MPKLPLPLTILMVGLLPLLGSCGGGEAPGGSDRAGAASVVAADGVLCDLGRTLAGEDLTVNCLLEGGDDPHTFSLTPQQSRLLAEADHVFLTGLDLTPALADLPAGERVTRVGEQPGVRPVTLTAAEDHDHDDHDQEAHDHGAHDHGDSGLDPHVWHDPRNTAAMAQVVARVMGDLQPQQAEAIARRRDAAVALLGEMDRWAAAAFASVPEQQRVLASRHRGFATLADHYGLEDLALLDAHSSSELLSPDALAQLNERLRSLGVTMLFPEQDPATKSMRTISRRSGIPLADRPIAADGTAPEGDLVTTFVGNVCTISEGLGGRCDRAAGEDLEARWKAVRTLR